MPSVDVDVTNSLTTVIGALTLLVVVLLGIGTKALTYAKIGATQSAQANRAVNNVGGGEHRLYDKVDHINEKLTVLIAAQIDFTEKGWRHLPADIGDATALTLTIRQLQHAVEGAQAQRAQIITDVAELTKLIKALDKKERI